MKEPNYKTKGSFIKHIDFICADLMILELSYILAKLWYHYSFGTPLLFGSQFRQQCLILFACFIVSMTLSHPYKNVLKRDKWKEIAATIEHAVYMAIMDIILMYIMKDTTSTSRLTFAATWILYIIFETVFRLSWKRVIRYFIIKHSRSRRQIIVLTSKDRLSLVKNNLGKYLFRDYDLAGIFLSDFTGNEDNKFDSKQTNILGGINNIVDYSVHNWVDEVIFDIPHDDTLEELEIEFSKMGIETHYTVAVLENSVENIDGSYTYIERIGNFVVLTHKEREISPLQITLKRLLDLVGGIIGSIIAAIIIIIVGPIIKRQSPGPIIFTQERVGKNGKVFKMYKIRSMYLDAEERKAALMSKNKMDGFMFKIDDDPRIIGSEKKDKNGKPKGIGNFIRNTSLDEFPQFFNVVKGDMSLVGTRPPTVDEWEKYSVQHRKRISIKPGITGLWQISGRSEITDFDEVVKLDSEYIDNWTVGMDIKILFQTIAKVAKKEGAE